MSNTNPKLKVGLFDALKAVSYGTTTVVIKSTAIAVSTLDAVDNTVGLVNDTVLASRKVSNFGLDTWTIEAEADHIVAVEEANTLIHEAQVKAEAIRKARAVKPRAKKQPTSAK